MSQILNLTSYNFLFKIKFHIKKLEIPFLMDKSNEVYCKNNKLQKWFRIFRSLCFKYFPYYYIFFT